MGSGGYFLPDRTDPQTDSGPHLRDSEGGLSGLAAQPLGEEQVEPTGDPAAVPATLAQVPAQNSGTRKTAKPERSKALNSTWELSPVALCEDAHDVNPGLHCQVSQLPECEGCTESFPRTQAQHSCFYFSNNEKSRNTSVLMLCC